jgi:hypothetical protein
MVLLFILFPVPRKREPAERFGCLLTFCHAHLACGSPQFKEIYKLMKRVRTVRSNRLNAPNLP